jgi:hypothetical protein
VSDIRVGLVIDIAHPFIKTTFSEQDQDGFTEVSTWSPGVRFEDMGEGDIESVADGIGAQLLTIVDIHKPGKFPTRVFYTRKWRDPAGKVFGKGALRIRSRAAFAMLAGGYRHEYTLDAQQDTAALSGEKAQG